MGEHVHINTELKVIYYPDTKAQLTRDDIVMIFGESEAVDRCIEFAASLQKLKLTYEEVAVLKAIILTFRGTHFLLFVCMYTEKFLAISSLSEIGKFDTG